MKAKQMLLEHTGIIFKKVGHALNLLKNRYSMASARSMECKAFLPDNHMPRELMDTDSDKQSICEQFLELPFQLPIQLDQQSELSVKNQDNGF